ncbi:MAG: hypothetical protein HC820_01585 [Hydrococcus sp. RM1_1_31]|nr:hypothetical protein [Hydrococcus sp. RM1_1_31]
MQPKHEKQLQKLQLETVAILDRIINIFDELPTIIAQEESLAIEQNLNNEIGERESFSQTRLRLQYLKIDIIQAKTFLGLIQSASTRYKPSSSYSSGINLSCLPQEDDRWVVRATTWDLPDEVIVYGATQPKAIAEALLAIAALFDKNSSLIEKNYYEQTKL